MPSCTPNSTALPTASRLTQYAWYTRTYNMHRERVRTARTHIDNELKESTKKLKFKGNPKRKQMQYERTAEIVRQNHILYERIEAIIHRQKREQEVREELHQK